MTPRVSVVMPVRNGAAFLRPAMASILRQTCGSFEFLIINDASTDNSLEIIGEFEDNRISIIHNSAQQGIARSRNRGAEAARGEYVAIMDQDDVSAPGRLEAEADYLDRHREVAAVGSWVQVINEADEVIEEWRRECEPAEIRDALIRDRCVMANSSVLIRKAALREAGGLRRIPIVDDYDLWLRMTDTRACLANVPAFLLQYRRHGGQTCQRNSEALGFWFFAVQFAARRRREGRSDPLDGLLKFDLEEMTPRLMAGRGSIGQAWAVRRHWLRGMKAWDRGRRAAALPDLLWTVARCPGYAPFWARVHQLVRRVSKHQERPAGV